jgi:MoxR-like ATPase
LRDLVDEVFMDEKIEEYILDLVAATREPGAFDLGELDGLIRYGASPRATIYLAMAAKGHAFLCGRGYVSPQDIKCVGMDVLRHRVIVTYEAEAQNKTSEDILERIFNTIDVP